MGSMSRPRPHSRSRKRVAAVSVASFLALLGYQAARMHAGSDPALAQTKHKASTTQSGTQSTTQSDEGSSSTDGYGSEAW